MSITIENPTAETIYAALRQVPEAEIVRLRALLNADGEQPNEEEDAWHAASAAASARFFEEEA